MYLIRLSITDFETRILDIAYLLMLKIQKHPDFRPSKMFVNLYLKVLKKHGLYKEALQFTAQCPAELLPDKLLVEAELQFRNKDFFTSVNSFYRILAENDPYSFKEIWPVYQRCIRLMCHEELPTRIQLKPTMDYSIQGGSQKF